MSDFVDYVRDQLRDIGPFTVRAMFGGHGLYWRGLFFGLIAADTLYLRTDARNRDDYVARGLSPFKPWEDRSVTLKAYYPVPEDVLEDPDTAGAWARAAIDAAQAAGPPPSTARRTTLRQSDEAAPRRGRTPRPSAKR
ncbi:TfoX/Sxy family protein [Reyranella sp. CPCC 100927]|uniref:TfoX/Sxy family protein n=1 Tax=Reyranella sp. CPCC 100927 TaxID=2599616 RepID=UPI0011B4A9FD|nr:TfoX/Sxy family protein [Reyranella sp. CPCC 100927]TWT01989.1 TfoX/Sxy family protein [Reyranella sp. CPCC 100927]